jgi:hypothetical protein
MSRPDPPEHAVALAGEQKVFRKQRNVAESLQMMRSCTAALI